MDGECQYYVNPVTVFFLDLFLSFDPMLSNDIQICYIVLLNQTNTGIVFKDFLNSSLNMLYLWTVSTVVFVCHIFVVLSLSTLVSHRLHVLHLKKIYFMYQLLVLHNIGQQSLHKKLYITCKNISYIKIALTISPRCTNEHQEIKMRNFWKPSSLQILIWTLVPYKTLNNDKISQCFFFIAHLLSMHRDPHLSKYMACLPSITHFLSFLSL